MGRRSGMALKEEEAMATKVLVLGASGRIARWAVAMLGERSVEQTLLLRDRRKLRDVPANATVIEGDVLDADVLAEAVRGRDIVYANLAGDVDAQARAIVKAMEDAGVGRLVFVTALGIYDEVPGEFGRWNRTQIGQMLTPYRAAADVIEESDLDYTILRPAWLTDGEEIDFETTEKDEPFRGTVVSRKSVAALVVEIIEDPSRHSRASIGVDKPGSDGDRPSFM